MNEAGKIELSERETLVHRIGYLKGSRDELATLQRRIEAELDGALAELARMTAPQGEGAGDA